MRMMNIGPQELLVVFIIALLVLGPDKLPVYAKKLGEALRQFKKYSSEATRDLRETVIEPLEEAQRPLKEAMEPITELEKEVQDIKKTLTGVGKPSAKKPVKQTEKPEPAGEAVAAEETAEESAVSEETDNVGAPVIKETVDAATAGVEETEHAAAFVNDATAAQSDESVEQTM